MAGEARSDLFLLSTATVMIGPAANIQDLQPETHSIGLVQNFRVTAEPEYADLGQGVKNDVVQSVTINENITVSMEAYEFTGRNLQYAAGLDGGELKTVGNVYTTSGAPSGNSVDLSGSPSAGDFPDDSWVTIQDGTTDKVHVGQVSSFATNTITLTSSTEIPGGVTFSANSRVARVTKVAPNRSVFQPYFAAKVVGHLPKDARPVVLYFPKIKVTRGFDIGMSREQHSNLPFEFRPHSQIPGDPTYADWGQDKVIAFFSGGGS